MHVADFVASRPYAFHLTARSNLDGIRRAGRLYPAAHSIAASDTGLRVRRVKHVELSVDDLSFHIRDQQPLHQGNCALDGWTFPELIEELNRRVFFWPGSNGPISYGRRHYDRYSSERPRIIRIPTSDLFAANARLTPEVCKYNSGSPRCSNGRKSPRGPGTFTPLVDSSLRPAQVVELTYRDAVLLPNTARVASGPDGPWSAL